MKTEAKLWPLEGEQGFKETLPSDLVTSSFWPNMTHIPTWPRYHQDKRSGISED